VSASSNPENPLVAAAKAKLADQDPDAPLVDNLVWDQALADALLDVSRFKPRRLKITVEFQSGEDTVELPPDFIEFDMHDLNRVLKPLGYQATIRGTVFAFEWLSAASADISHGLPYQTLGLFHRDTTFQIIDAEDGGKEMWLDPAPTSSKTVKTLYHARHQVRVEGEDPETEPAINTVPEEARDMLLSRMCYHALIALSVLVAADKDLSARLVEIAEKFDRDYERRFAFAPYGRRA
jgi:hypothetical protein